MISLNFEMPGEDVLEKYAAELSERPSPAAFWDRRMYKTHVPILGRAVNADDILAESNYATALEYLEGEAACTECEGKCCWDADDNAITDGHDEDVFDAAANHWAFGQIDQIWVRIRDEAGGFTPTFIAAVRILEWLKDYPILDDSDYSERESEAMAAEIQDSLDRLDDHDELGMPEDIWKTIVAGLEEWAYERLSENGSVPSEREIEDRFEEKVAEVRMAAWEAYAKSLNPSQTETLPIGV